MDFVDLSAQCAPNVAPQTMAAIVSVESSHNPYAIGVVDGRLVRQPRSRAEAIATALQLERQGKNFSMGMAQVNRHNLPRYNVTYAQIFDVCTNLRVGARILEECYQRAMPLKGSPQAALRAAFSCYYSGNFSRGFQPDKPGERSYVDKVVAASGTAALTQVVPAIEPSSFPALQAAVQARVSDPLVIEPDPTAMPTVLAEQRNGAAVTQPTIVPAEVSAQSQEDGSPNSQAEQSALVF